ncbi:MAG: PQQ-like beta-propeller repeat protein [Dehalococcoidia bacterium]|nr:PQQ-like beta-propeller repeat protein [Dehalococcoidia bacterium]
MSRRVALAATFIFAFALFAAGCTGVKNPEGWAAPEVPADSSIAYVSLQKGRISAVDLATGSVVWRFPDKDRFADQEDISTKAFYGQPVVDLGNESDEADDVVFVADYEGKIFALNLADGSIRWKLESFSGKVLDGPVVQGDVLVFATDDGHVHALKKADGAPADGWARGGVDVGGIIWAPVAVTEDTIYTASMQGDVHALNLSDGSRAWSEPFSTEGAITSLAELPGGRLFLGTLDNQVILLDATTGNAVGEPFDASDWVWTEPAVAGNTVYFGDFEGRVYALDITDSGFQPKWPEPFKADSRVKSGGVILGETLVVGDRAGTVSFISLADGTGRKVPILESGNIGAGLAEYDGQALVITTEGDMFLANGETTQVTPLSGGAR